MAAESSGNKTTLVLYIDGGLQLYHEERKRNYVEMMAKCENRRVEFRLCQRSPLSEIEEFISNEAEQSEDKFERIAVIFDAFHGEDKKGHLMLRFTHEAADQKSLKVLRDEFVSAKELKNFVKDGFKSKPLIILWPNFTNAVFRKADQDEFLVSLIKKPENYSSMSVADAFLLFLNQQLSTKAELKTSCEGNEDENKTSHGAEFRSKVSDFSDNRNRFKKGYHRFRREYRGFRK